MKTIIYYDANSIDSLLCTFLYKNYMGYLSLTGDVFIPYDGRNLTELPIDPQTANAYDRYIFFELPPNQASLTTLLANQKSVILFAYAPPNWQQNLGAVIVPMGEAMTVAKVFSGWLLTEADSVSFYRQLVTVLALVDHFELWCSMYLNDVTREDLRYTFQYLNEIVKTGYSTTGQDLKSQLLGSWASANALADASAIFAGSVAAQVPIGIETPVLYQIYRLQVQANQLQAVDRHLTQNYLSPYFSNDNTTFVEYWDAVPANDEDDHHLIKITLKPIDFLIPPILERNQQALTDLVGQDAIASMTAYKEGWYDTLVGGPYPDMVQGQDGTFSLTVTTEAFFEGTVRVQD
jgi:hypothetical protein